MSDRPFMPGDRVVLIEDGSVGIVRWSKHGRSAINWIDEDPEEFGGSVVPDERLRRQDVRGAAEDDGEALGFAEAVAFVTNLIGREVSVVVMGRDTEGDGVVAEFTGTLRAVGPDPSDPNSGGSGPVMFGFQSQDNAFFIDPDAFLRGSTWGDDYLRIDLTFGVMEVAGPILRPDWF